MEIDIINNAGEIIVAIYQGRENYTMRFWTEKEAMDFCEKILKRYDYRVSRYDRDIREEADQ